MVLFFAKLVSYTFLYWLPNYIKMSGKVDPRKAADLSTLFDLGGIFGGVVAGAISDMTGASASVCCLMLFLAMPTVRRLCLFFLFFFSFRVSPISWHPNISFSILIIKLMPTTVLLY